MRLTAVTPTNRPKSVRNRCVIEVFGGVFNVVMILLDSSVSVGAYRTESYLFLFLLQPFIPTLV